MKYCPVFRTTIAVLFAIALSEQLVEVLPFVIFAV